MVDDELPPNEGDETIIPPGPRRSTYTPPPGGIRFEAVTGEGADGVDDGGPELRWAPPTVEAEPTSSVPEASALVGAVPPPPARRSLTDAELLAAADPAAADTDSGALLDLVEKQLELRRSEAQQLAEWERTVREAAPDEAESIVAAARAQFRDVVPPVEVAKTPALEPRPEPTPDPTPTMAERLASAPPPEPPAAPESFAASAPALDLALADAPPPWGQVPSAVVPPPLVEPELQSSSAGSPPLAPESALGLFDDMLREPEPVADASATEITEHLTPDAAAEPASEPPPVPADAAADGASAADVLAGEDLLPVGPRAGRVEVIALEPTPAEQRAGRSLRMFWVWFAVNASVVSLALGAVILGSGLSLRQAVLATLIGVALSFLPLGLGTLAGKWSGQPTMVVSRATFGTVGNVIPAVLALVTRVAWAGALLWMLGTGVAEILIGSGLVTGVGRLELSLGIAAVGLVGAAVIAGIGFGLLAVVSAVVTALAAVLVVGLVVLTLPSVDLGAALSVPDGDWMLMAGGAVLVFSVVGLAWAMSTGDVARYQARGTSGSAALLWTALGATIPAFALISWGAVLAASNPVIAEGLQQNPLDLIGRLLPLWYPAPLIAAVALSLLSAITLALYSGGFALLAVGVRAPRWAAVLAVVMLTGAAAAVLLALVPDTTTLLRDVLTTLAVPVAAWAGIFAAETMIRTRRVHSPSLLRRGGVYPVIRWVNLSMLLVITGLGWGFTTAALPGLSWQGYLAPLVGIAPDSTLATADIGVLLALALGLLTPLIAGIPALRRLQTAEREAAEGDSGVELAPIPPGPSA